MFYEDSRDGFEDIEAHLANKYRLKPEQVQRILNAAKRAVEKDLIQMRQSWEDDNWDALRRAAHSLKSSLANMGMTELSDMAARLEHSVDSEFSEESNSLLENLEVHLASFRDTN